MGSGIALKRAKEKYGIENFKKEILNIYDNKEEMVAKEKELVNKEFVNNPASYNVAEGGQGGNLGDLVNKKIGEHTKTMWNNPVFRQKVTTSINDRWKDLTYRERHSERMREFWKNNPELKLKIARTSSQVNKGRKRDDLVKRNRENVKTFCLINSNTGEMVEGKNIAQFCRERNLCLSALCQVVARKPRYKSHKGWEVFDKTL